VGWGWGGGGGGGGLLEGRGEEERGEVDVPVDLLSFFGLLLDLERQYGL